MRTRFKGWRIRIGIKVKLVSVAIQARFKRAKRLAHIFIWKRIVAPLYWRMSKGIDMLIATGEANVEDFSIEETVNNFSSYAIERDYFHER
jgi:uncharacterized protein YybS (DUF2232 family)